MTNYMGYDKLLFQELFLLGCLNEIHETANLWSVDFIPKLSIQYRSRCDTTWCGTYVPRMQSNLVVPFSSIASQHIPILTYELLALGGSHAWDRYMKRKPSKRF